MSQRPITRRHLLRGLAAAGGSFSSLGALAQAPSAEALAAAASAAGASLPGSPNDILIGQSAHFSGPLAPTSIAPAQGVDLAIAEFNRKGGVGGRKVRLIKMDDAYTPKRCVDNVHTLIDERKVVALYGLASTGNVAAVLPVLAEKKVPLVGVYTGSPTVRAKHHPYFFTGTASYRDEVVQMVRNLVAIQRTNLALVYQNSPFGQLMLPVVEEVAKELGATLVAKRSVEISGSDAEATVQALAPARPQAVLVMSFGVSVVGVVKAVRAHIGVPAYLVSVATTGNVINTLGDDSRGLAVTQVLPYPWRAATPLTREFTSAVERAKLAPDYELMLGYLNMRVLLEGLRRIKGAVTSESIVTAMEGLGKTDLGGYALNYGPQNHHGSNFVEITIVGPNRRFMR
ncbi:MAG: ABC transporter substrate-binding protein [Burkholderiales bacterium]|nr:ABC transporter substrate-binding protein [Burkholderiales bacterium]